MYREVSHHTTQAVPLASTAPGEGSGHPNKRKDSPPGKQSLLCDELHVSIFKIGMPGFLSHVLFAVVVLVCIKRAV